MKILKRVVLILLPLLFWTAFIGYRFIEGFLLKPITSDDSAAGFIEATQK